MSALNGYLTGGGAIILAFVGTYLKGRLSGAKLERDKQSAEAPRAGDIGHQVDNDIGAAA